MKLPVLHRVVALCLSFLVFGSSLGMAMDVHYCGNEFVNVNFFGKAKSCGMAESLEKKAAEKKDNQHACCHKPQSQKLAITIDARVVVKSNCCHNESYEIDSGQGTEVDEVAMPQLDHVIVFVTLFTPQIFTISTPYESTIFTNHDPPPQEEKINILHQVFLI